MVEDCWCLLVVVMLNSFDNTGCNKDNNTEVVLVTVAVLAAAAMVEVVMGQDLLVQTE